MRDDAGAIARALAEQAERVCRHYLSNGRREGGYWLAGDARNAPGRSLFVRLRATADGSGLPGKWTDGQSGEHGDLLDIIRAASPGSTLGEAVAEARRFLAMPDMEARARGLHHPVPAGSPAAARRLLAACKPIAGTLASAYLASRAIPALPAPALRFHPRCWYRRMAADATGTARAMPAMVAAVTDCAGETVGAHRTWLAPDGSAKANVACPRKAMGNLRGNGVRFAMAGPVMVAGEGVETILSLRLALPGLPAIAALSAAHLGALDFPPPLRCLYVAREPDRSGRLAFDRLRQRGLQHGIAVHPLDCAGADFNDDLCVNGLEALRACVHAQISGETWSGA